MKLYLITTTTGDKWEMSNGVMIIAAIDEESARNQFEKGGGEYECEWERTQQIDSICELFANDEGILFYQEPAIE